MRGGAVASCKRGSAGAVQGGVEHRDRREADAGPIFLSGLAQGAPQVRTEVPKRINAVEWSARMGG